MKDATSPYQRHGIMEQFSRYTSNNIVLTEMARLIGGGNGTGHMDLGFSARLSLFCGLTECLYAVNASSLQLTTGVQFLRNAIQYSQGTAPSNRTLAWLRRLAHNRWQELRNVIDHQRDIILNAGYQLRWPPVITLFHKNIETWQDAPEACCTSATMIDVLLHIDNPGKAFGIVRRVVRVGGHFLFTIYPPDTDSQLPSPSPSPSLRQFFQDFVADCIDPQWIGSTHIYPKKLRHAMEASGRDVSRTERARFWLDLPKVRMFTLDEIRVVGEEYGLEAEWYAVAPGGMFPAQRWAIRMRRTA